jgi:hypothetical protein
MRCSRALLSFLLLVFISDVSSAATLIQQDSQSRKQGDNTEKANPNQEGVGPFHSAADLPYLGRPIASLEFRGNKAFTSERLLSHFKYFKLDEPLPREFREFLQFELHRLRVMLYIDNGYLQARFHEPEFENTPAGVKITIAVEEGLLYRTGKVEVVDARQFSAEEVKEIIGFKKGDIVKADSILNKGVEALKRKYGELGYAQFDAYFQPTFHPPTADAGEAIADVTLILEEGEVYRIGKITYSGTDSATEALIRANLLIHEGEIFNRTLFDKSNVKLYRLLNREDLCYLDYEDGGVTQTDDASEREQMIILLQKVPSEKAPPVLPRRKK